MQWTINWRNENQTLSFFTTIIAIVLYTLIKFWSFPTSEWWDWFDFDVLFLFLSICWTTWLTFGSVSCCD